MVALFKEEEEVLLKRQRKEGNMIKGRCFKPFATRRNNVLSTPFSILTVIIIKRRQRRANPLLSRIPEANAFSRSQSHAQCICANQNRPARKKMPLDG